MLFIRCLKYLPLICWGSVFSPCFYALLSVLTSFAIILTKKRELVALG